RDRQSPGGAGVWRHALLQGLDGERWSAASTQQAHAWLAQPPPQAALLVIEFPVIVKVHATTRLDGRGGGRPTSKGIVAEGATDCTRSAMIPSPFMLAVSRCRTRENPHRPGRTRWAKLSKHET